MATSSSWSTNSSSSLFTSTSITWGTSSVSVTLPGGYYGTPYVGAYSPGLSVSGSGTSWTVNVGSLGVGTYFVRWISDYIVSPNTTNYYYSGIFITISAAPPSPVYIATSDSYPDFGQGFTITATCSGAARMSLWRSLDGGSSFTKIVQDDASNGTLTRNETASSTYPNLAYYAYGANDNWTSSSQSSTIYVTAVPASGTLLDTYCGTGATEYNKYGTYADGTGGSYDQLIEANSADCGFVAVSAPTGLSFTNDNDASATEQVTVTATGGYGTTLQVSNDNSNWYANGTKFNHARNSTVTYYARWISVSSTSSSYDDSHFVDYLSPNTGAAANNVSIGATATSATISITGGVATQEAYRVCASNAYTTNTQVVSNTLAAWTPYANDTQSISSSLPAQGNTNTYYVYAYRYATYGGDGQYKLAGSFTITRYIAEGTLLSTYCSGVDKYGTYADGSGGTTSSLIEANSTDCGWTAASYSLSKNYTSRNEGATLTATFTTSGTDVPASATYYWKATPIADFGSTYEGTVTTSSGSGTFTVTPIADSQTEGEETATITVYSDSGRTNSLASTTFTINDTSTSSSSTNSITIDGMQSGTTYIDVFSGQTYEINVSGNYYYGSVVDASNYVSFSPISWFGTGSTVVTADTATGYGSTYTSSTQTSTYIETITAPGGGTTYTNKLMITTFPSVVLPSSTTLTVATDYVQQPDITVTYSGNSGGNLYYQITTTTGATGTWALAPASPFTVNPGISRGSSTTAYIHWRNVPERPDGTEILAGAAYSYADTSAAVDYRPTALDATAGDIILDPSATTYNHSVTSGSANQYYKGELSGTYYGIEVYNDLQLSDISTTVVPRGDRKTFSLYTVLPVAKGGDGVYKDTTDNFYIRRKQSTPTISITDDNASGDTVTVTVTNTRIDGIVDTYQFSEDNGSTWVNVAGTTGAKTKDYIVDRGDSVDYAVRVANVALGVYSDAAYETYNTDITPPTDIVFVNDNLAADNDQVTVTASGGNGGTVKVSNDNITWVANGTKFSHSRGLTKTYYARREGTTANSSTYSENHSVYPTTPTGITVSYATTASATTSMTLTGTGGNGGTMLVSNNAGSTWQSNGNVYSVTRGTSYDIRAYRDGATAGIDSSQYNPADVLVPYLNPDTDVTVTGSPFSVGSNTTSLNIAITDVSTVEKVRVISSNVSGGPWTASAFGNTTISVATPAADSTGNYTVEIILKETSGGDETDWQTSDTTFTITRAANSAPSIDSFSASPSNTTGAQTVTLSAACSDSDGTVDSISITQVSGTTVTLSTQSESGIGTSSATASRTFTSPDADGTLVFQVSATDDDAGATGTAQITVVTNAQGTSTPTPSGDGYGLEVYGASGEVYLSVTDRVMSLGETGNITIPANTLSATGDFNKNGGTVIAVIQTNNFTGYFSYLTAANITWAAHPTDSTKVRVTATRASQDTDFGYGVEMSIDVLVVVD